MNQIKRFIIHDIQIEITTYERILKDFYTEKAVITANFLEFLGKEIYPLEIFGALYPTKHLHVLLMNMEFLVFY